MIATATEPPRSTYICADVFKYRGIVPFSQILATVLDCSIIILVVGLVSRGKASQSQDTKSYSSVGWAFIVCYTGIELSQAELTSSHRRFPPLFLPSAALYLSFFGPNIVPGPLHSRFIIFEVFAHLHPLRYFPCFVPYMQ